MFDIGLIRFLFCSLAGYSELNGLGPVHSLTLRGESHGPPLNFVQYTVHLNANVNISDATTPLTFIYNKSYVKIEKKKQRVDSVHKFFVVSCLSHT